MTGFGTASGQRDGITCTVEVRTVNNRFFKALVKLPDKLAPLEPLIDAVMRESILRGSVTLTVSVRDDLSTGSVTINQAVLDTYVKQIEDLRTRITGDKHVELAGLLNLPGVVEAGEDTAEYVATHQALVLGLVKDALAKLAEMRKKEGAALWADLSKHLDIIRAALVQISQLAPNVVKNYHEKLRARVLQMVSDARLSLSDQDLLKEVALFADRADISEEITRLGGHLDQFTNVCQKETGAGRKLDFIAQEMLREANTIASKANDATIARLTVDIKSCIDRIKEQSANVE